MQTKNTTWIYGNNVVVPKIRIIADAGKQITQDGINLYNCIDVDEANGWYEVDAPDPTTEATIEDYQQALAELGVK